MDVCNVDNDLSISIIKYTTEVFESGMTATIGRSGMRGLPGIAVCNYLQIRPRDLSLRVYIPRGCYIPQKLAVERSCHSFYRSPCARDLRIVRSDI